jgi:hypothetical protein
MNDLNNIKKHVRDEVDLHDVAEQDDEAVVEIGSEELEEVSGGLDGAAIGHN